MEGSFLEGRRSMIKRLDNRGLEPPQPMIRTLELLETMTDEDILIINNDRKPMFLFPELDELGYQYVATKLDNGSFEIKIGKTL